MSLIKVNKVSKVYDGTAVPVKALTEVELSIESGEFDQGILICGSANGISMAANKHQGIRCAVCWNREIALLARQHNDANILALPGRFIELDEAKACVDVFLNTAFEGGRHSTRVEKIRC